MGITKSWGKIVVVAGCLSAMSNVAHAGYDENVGAASDSSSSNMSGSMQMSRSEMRMKNAQMLIQTLSEEKTEINALMVQSAALMRMGGAQNMQLARVFKRWAAEHKAAGPALMRLIRINGGDPMEAKILMAPVTGSVAAILMAQHKDHEAAVMTSQMRYMMTTSSSIKNAMHKRANLARKHLKQMMAFHSMMNTGMGDMSTSSSTTTTTTTTDSTMGTDDSATTDNSAATDSTTTTDDSTGMTGTMDSNDSTTTTTDSTTTTTDSTTATTDDSTMSTDTPGNDTKGADGAGTPDSTMDSSSDSSSDSTMTN